ncbi:MAG: transcription elongation factor GreA [Bacilli bacterium]|nr:transcription elongation factor GreA [Erysipelotrichaceae bacterium]MDY4818895.1 transcription elongation factor GreA [Bacilli bacterium]MDY5669467.1 transcription elongation factor GreA [Bacilli bacterium]
MSNEKIVLTKEGAEKLRAEYEDLVHNQRIAIASDVEAARAQGDLSENADYHASKDKLAEIDRRIAEIEETLRNSTIVQEKSKVSKTVVIGTNVKIRDLSDNSETTYRITSTVEADPMNNVISNESPLGKALFGKRVGDIAVVKVAEEYSVEILAIEK